MNLYMKFIELSDRVQFECDDSCLSLLDQVGLAESQGACLTVTKAMNLAWIASPATLHRRLDMLVETGYISHAFKAGNRRTKLIITTPKAIKYFKEMEECLLHSTRK